MRERPKIEVPSSPVRCPFCHEDIAVSSDEWIACAECLARHHIACWRESQRCGTCGGTRTLEPTRAIIGQASSPNVREVSFDPGRTAEVHPGVGLFAFVALSWMIGLLVSIGAFRFYEPPGGTGLWRYEHPTHAAVIESIPWVLPLLVLGVGLMVLRARRRRAAKDEPGA